MDPLQAIDAINGRLLQVRQETAKLLLLPIAGCPLAAIRRNRLRVLSAIEFNLINRKCHLLERMFTDDDPADFWKKNE